MAGIAKVTLVGKLGRDPETRYTPNGIMNVQFTMAVNRRWTDQGGQQQERTTWFRITAWRKLAETLDGLTQRGFLVKGKEVFVLGNIEAREYQDREGQTRMSLDVTADEVQMVGNRPDGESAPRAGGSGPRETNEFESGADDFSDVPF